MTRPNVLLVTVDSLRADHVSVCVSGSSVDTPGIDRVGQRGTTFTDAIAQGPFTTFSMPSLFSSRYPSGMQYVELAESVVGVTPSAETQTLTETLSADGYETGGFHSNPLLSELFEFDRGFDVLEADLPFARFTLPGRLKLLTNKVRRLLRSYSYLPAETITDRAMGWVDEREGDRPFFCWTHYMDPHGPYQPHSGFTYYQKYRSEGLWQKAVRTPESITDDEREQLRTAYQAEVAYTDSHVRRLVEGVRARSERPTVVVVTADHGDAFGEHGYYSHPHQIHDELVRVPLLVDAPTLDLPDRVETPVELLDVAPSILAAADVEVPDSFEGAPLRDGDADQHAIAEGELRPGYRAAVFTEECKYVVDDIADRTMLFDRASGDTVDGQARADSFDALRSIVEAHRNRSGAQTQSAHEADIDDEDVRDRLQKLGYLE